ncbi:MAG TPA: hypothetical protein VGE85_11585 [Terracidiphilus sp.]
MSRIRRRTIPGEGDEALELSQADQLAEENHASEEEALRIAARMGGRDIEDWIEGLTDEEVRSWVHFCYRTEPLPKNVRSMCLYRNLPLIDLVDVDGICNLRKYLINYEHGGGGTYRIHVMPPGKGKRENIANGTIRIPGAPKLPPAEVPTATAITSLGNMGSEGLAIEDLRNAQNQNPIKDARETLNLVKELGDTMKPAPATDQISQLTALAGLLKQLTPAPPAAVPVSAPVDPLDTYLKVRNVVKEIAAEAAPPPVPTQGRASELVELIKAGGPGAIDLAKAIYGSPAEPGGFGSAAGEALTTLIRDRPQAIGQAWDLITHGLSTVLSKISGPVSVRADESAPPPGAQASQPVARLGDDSRVGSSIGAQPAPADEPLGLGMPPQAVVDDIFGIVVTNFRRGLDGTTVGIIILGAFPKMQPFLQMVCAEELDVVLPALRQQPAIAPIVDDALFPAFYTGFREMCLSGLPTAEDFSEDSIEEETK